MKDNSESRFSTNREAISNATIDLMRVRSCSRIERLAAMLNTCKSDGKWCFQWRTATLGLRHGPDSYGRQQWGIFRNGRKPDGAMPRAAVIQRMQALSGMIGRKASVGGFLSPPSNPRAQLWTGGGNYQAGVRMGRAGPTLNTERTKARIYNGIRYPSSPSRKRWILGAVRIYMCSAVANALSIPPGETLPGLDMPRILFKERGAFGNANTGGAWLASARVAMRGMPEGRASDWSESVNKVISQRLAMEMEEGGERTLGERSTTESCAMIYFTGEVSGSSPGWPSCAREKVIRREASCRPSCMLNFGSGDIAQLVELRSCNWVVAITGWAVRVGEGQSLILKTSAKESAKKGGKLSVPGSPVAGSSRTIRILSLESVGEDWQLTIRYTSSNVGDHCTFARGESRDQSQLQFLISGGGSKAWNGAINPWNPYEMKFYYDGQVCHSAQPRGSLGLDLVHYCCIDLAFHNRLSSMPFLFLRIMESTYTEKGLRFAQRTLRFDQESCDLLKALLRFAQDKFTAFCLKDIAFCLEDVAV
ncbi:hypothetical protein Tco_0902297 [Tanacetum coccineum]